MKTKRIIFIQNIYLNQEAKNKLTWSEPKIKMNKHKKHFYKQFNKQFTIIQSKNKYIKKIG